MTVSNPKVIDFISLDSRTDTVVLSLVEEREWGLRGELLPDLQAKLNAYLAFVLDGHLADEYPQYARKTIQFRLHHQSPLSPMDQEFIERVRREHLDPEGIGWEQSLVRTDDGLSES